jgi:hypothetical protein
MDIAMLREMLHGRRRDFSLNRNPLYLFVSVRFCGKTGVHFAPMRRADQAVGSVWPKRLTGRDGEMTIAAEPGLRYSKSATPFRGVNATATGGLRHEN